MMDKRPENSRAMSLMQPVQILQTGMKFMFDLDPTITEQLYHHSLSQVAIITAISAQLFKTVADRVSKQPLLSSGRLRASLTEAGAITQ